jgi:DNA-directed RNA polymerase subunit K/omega
VTIQHPSGVGAFRFVVLASLRTVQLARGCRPRIDGVHKHTVIAQLEVAQGKVVQAPPAQWHQTDKLIEV